MPSARATLALALAAAAAALLAGLAAAGPPDLRPVMPEVDGVHPVRALQALHTAYAPGAGFVDKYPPLGSVLLGLAAARADDWFSADAGDILRQSDPEQHLTLWRLRDRLAAMLDAERWVSRLAMAAAAAAVAALALAAGTGVAGAALAGLVFLASYPALYYGSTANVDALALAGQLWTLWLAIGRRWLGAGVALALSVAVKDPAYVLAPVLLAACWRAAPAGPPTVAGPSPSAAGRGRRVGGMVLAAALVYAAASGLLTSPHAWWEHVRYLGSSGLGQVDRIDPVRPADVALLLGHVGDLLAGAIGWSGLLIGVAGLAGLLARRAPGAGVLAGSVLATLALFVLPVGFAYVRFLLVPLAVLAVGAGSELASLPGRLRAGPARRRAGAAALLGVAAVLAVTLDGRLAVHHPLAGPVADPRREAVAALQSLAPRGSRIVCFADEREHGPPLDPETWAVETPRLVGVNERLPGWRAAPFRDRPEFVLWMGFPIDRPSGRGPVPLQPPSFAGLYEVIAEFGAATPGPVDRALAIRPRLQLLRRIDA